MTQTSTRRDLSTSETRALLALMLAHSSRLAARIDSEGRPILLADQDRSRWDRRLIATASFWLERSKTESPSRFHFEAAISLVHCRAASVSETDWRGIVRLYDRLLALHDSPLYVLNRAIARGEAGDVETALAELESIRQHPEMRGYFLLECAMGQLHELASRTDAAIDAYTSARSVAGAPHERALIDKKLARLLGA